MLAVLVRRSPFQKFLTDCYAWCHFTINSLPGSFVVLPNFFLHKEVVCSLCSGLWITLNKRICFPHSAFSLLYCQCTSRVPPNIFIIPFFLCLPLECYLHWVSTYFNTILLSLIFKFIKIFCVPSRVHLQAFPFQLTTALNLDSAFSLPALDICHLLLWQLESNLTQVPELLWGRWKKPLVPSQLCHKETFLHSPPLPQKGD